MSPIKLFNTMSKSKQIFNPLVEGRVGIYTCGPTVYDFAHVGNLRAYTFADTLARVLKANGYNVNHVMNITDVGHLTSDADSGDDKMEKGAKRDHKTAWEIADFYTEAFLYDVKRMRIYQPTVLCRATQHIPQMISLIQRLEKNGHTYLAGGNVYYDTTTFPIYRKMAGLRDENNTVARVESDPNKRHLFDFVLWFTSHKHGSHQMIWDSPWGSGFPGWHIECSAMAMHYLGERIDIHTGGIDHIPIHHTNEIAQSEGAIGHKWVNYWLHNEFLINNLGEKMAKSSASFSTLNALIENGFSPEDYRYFLLTGHYRSKLTYSMRSLESAKSSVQRLRTKISAIASQPLGDANNEAIKSSWEEFLEAANDDLNTSVCLAVLWKTIGSNETSATKLALLRRYETVFGLGLDEMIDRQPGETPTEINELAKRRFEARQSHDWALADQLRDQLSKLGYEVQDTGDSYTLIRNH